MDSNIALWQFLLDLLLNQEHVGILDWTDNSGEFKLIRPEKVAQLWGQKKNKPHMNYEKLSRALRYYYEKNIIKKVASKKFVYRFVDLPDSILKEIAKRNSGQKSECDFIEIFKLENSNSSYENFISFVNREKTCSVKSEKKDSNFKNFIENNKHYSIDTKLSFSNKINFSNATNYSLITSSSNRGLVIDNTCLKSDSFNKLFKFYTKDNYHSDNNVNDPMKISLQKIVLPKISCFQEGPVASQLTRLCFSDKLDKNNKHICLEKDNGNLKATESSKRGSETVLTPVVYDSKRTLINSKLEKQNEESISGTFEENNCSKKEIHKQNLRIKPDPLILPSSISNSSNNNLFFVYSPQLQLQTNSPRKNSSLNSLLPSTNLHFWSTISPFWSKTPKPFDLNNSPFFKQNSSVCQSTSNHFSFFNFPQHDDSRDLKTPIKIKLKEENLSN